MVAGLAALVAVVSLTQVANRSIRRTPTRDEKRCGACPVFLPHDAVLYSLCVSEVSKALERAKEQKTRQHTKTVQSPPHPHPPERNSAQ